MIICWTWTWTNNGNYALLNEISLLLIGSVGKFNQAHHFTGGMGSFFENASRLWYLGDNLFSVVYQPAVRLSIILISGYLPTFNPRMKCRQVKTFSQLNCIIYDSTVGFRRREASTPRRLQKPQPMMVDCDYHQRMIRFGLNAMKAETV